MLRSPPRCSQTKPVCRAEVGGQKLPATEYLGRRKHSTPSTRVQRHPAQASSVSVPMVFRRSAGARPGLRRQFFGASRDRKSTRLNSSHVAISYAVFCLKKKISTLK